MKQIENKIPTEEDWQGYQDEMDARYTYDILFGKTLQQAMPVFQQSCYERIWELRFLPVTVFQYYILAVRDYFIEGYYTPKDSDYIVDAYFSLVQLQLDQYPERILPVMEELLPSLHFIADHVATFNINEEIYGSIPARLQRLLQRYRQLQN